MIYIILGFNPDARSASHKFCFTDAFHWTVAFITIIDRIRTGNQ